ncbi:MAG: ribosome silencing factor [Myxococcota bacterium]
MTRSERLSKAMSIAEAALDRKAEDVVAIDVSGFTSFADVFVIATGTSDRNARAIADSICETMATQGCKPLGVEGYGEGRWVLIDLVDVIVHVFQREMREEYDLERLWSDAPRLDLDGGSGRLAAQP